MTEILKSTAAALQKNNMEVHCCAHQEEIIPLLKTMLKPNQTIGVGGSATLQQIGVLEFIRSKDYRFLDRYAENLSREETVKVMKESLTADVFISSTNAITENGELFNVDGNGNRVAPMIFGPETVIIIAGANKIVPNIDAAVQRVKTVAAPLNTKRLKRKTPCNITGECFAVTQGQHELCSGCDSEERICAAYTVLTKQLQKNRIKIILCEESLGY